MRIGVNIPDVTADEVYLSHFIEFLQKMADRIVQGHYRYGLPDRRKRYQDRLFKEAAAYAKTGNIEHLFNIANYAFLETCQPQNPKFHYDSSAKSVTRRDSDG